MKKEPIEIVKETLIEEFTRTCIESMVSSIMGFLVGMGKKPRRLIVNCNFSQKIKGEDQIRRYRLHLHIVREDEKSETVDIEEDDDKDLTLEF